LRSRHDWIILFLAMSMSSVCFLGPFLANGLLCDQDHARLDRLPLPAYYSSCFWRPLEGSRSPVRSLSRPSTVAFSQRISDMRAMRCPPSLFRLELNRTMANFPLSIHTSDRRPASHLQAELPRSTFYRWSPKGSPPACILPRSS
jgi:hypothetical protein